MRIIGDVLPCAQSRSIRPEYSLISLESLQRRISIDRSWLLIELQQGEYKEAEGLFRETAQGQETVLGKEHVDTLCSCTG